jgi:hypothetical protein
VSPGVTWGAYWDLDLLFYGDNYVVGVGVCCYPVWLGDLLHKKGSQTQARDLK